MRNTTMASAQNGESKVTRTAASFHGSGMERADPGKCGPYELDIQSTLDVVMK